LHVRAGRTHEYRSLCERLLERFERAPHHYVVIICKLAPGAVADLSPPIRAAERLVDREPQNAEYIGILGAALYRKGDLEAAARRLEVGIRGGPEQLGVQFRKLVLAMAYHRMGRGAEAQLMFQEVTRWMERHKLNGQPRSTLLLS
jgi:tetratricopeptide (TPR) repeat protein